MLAALWRITLLSLALASALRAGEPVSFSPGPDDRYRSPLYEVRSAGGDPAFVYWRENGWKNLPGKDGDTWPYEAMSADNHWVSLSANGQVHLTIRVIGIEPERVELLPARPGNTATVAADGSVQVTLTLVDDHPGYYFVRINGEHGDKHPLFIFADPPETDVPAKGPGTTTVEGITVIDAPSYNLALTGRHAVRRVKLLSWNYSTDGIGGSPGLVDHCFFKVNDDVFTLYHSERTLRNLVIWKQMNQAVFQLGYGYPQAVSDILVEKVEIIRDETETQNGHRGIIVLAASKGCAFSNVRFRDITLHGDTLNLLAIDNLDQDTPWSMKIEDVTLREIDLALERVTVTGTERGRWWGPFKDHEGQPMRSRLRTADPGKIRVRFEDVSIGGVRLESEKDFPNGIETQGDGRLEFR